MSKNEQVEALANDVTRSGEVISLVELFYRLAPRCGLDQMVDSDDFRAILEALDAHHDATQAQIAALEKRVAELEKANEEMGRRTAGLKVIGEQGPCWEQIIDVTKLTSEE